MRTDEPAPAAARAPTVASLVRAACAGDRSAFGALYERYAPAMHGLLLAHADPDDVPDLLQDVFIVAMEELHTLRDPAAFGGWVATIARNRARMLHRRRPKLVELTDDIPARAPLEPEGVELYAAIRTLPETYREPLMLRLVEGLSGVEIAERLGLTHGTVRVYLNRGVNMLRERLGGRDG